MFVGAAAHADSVEDVDRLVCSAGQVQICVEYDTCYPSSAGELGMPQFVILDLKKKRISTTEASEENRSTEIRTLQREEGQIYLQGVEGGRAFSFLIDEASGRMTVAVSRDGVSVTAFGACTDADL